MQARDALMREAVANPDEHGLKFMGERMPFEGQTLEESLSEPDIFDEQGRLRQTLPQGEEEKEEEFEPDAAAEHMRRIMTSRDVAIRDAWTVLKNDFFNPPMVPCAKCGAKTEPMMYYGSNEMGPQHNTLVSDAKMK